MPELATFKPAVGTRDDPAPLSPLSFARLASLITGELGIKMPESKICMVQSRLMRRVRELGLESIEAYTHYLLEQDVTLAERSQLINAITTNKTDFFRESPHFQYLLDSVLPSLQRIRKTEPVCEVNLWSAGCSSGEEPYTLAMLLAEYASGQPGFSFSVLATDVSTKVLEHAREGIYDESGIGPIPIELRSRYLRRNRIEPHLVRIVPELRRRISFHRLNFMEERYPIQDRFDVVFFRNVMIYFNRDTQERVVQKICRHLRPGGYLFIGHSESLSGLDVPLNPVHTAVFRKPPGGRPRS